MIKASCFTNLDEFKGVAWPTLFLALPRVGDRVEGRRGHGASATYPSLKVVSITHGMRGDLPFLTVELHR